MQRLVGIRYCKKRTAQFPPAGTECAAFDFAPLVQGILSLSHPSLPELAED